MYTGNPTIITLRHAYSGRSLLAMSLTAHGSWRLGGVVESLCQACAQSLYLPRAGWADGGASGRSLCTKIWKRPSPPQQRGASPPSWQSRFKASADSSCRPKIISGASCPIVKAAGGVFISDEVQTGWGRTGCKWFGIEQWGVEADIMTFAKGMGNGSPIGCTIATPEVADAVKGLTFSTFGGNPVTMATTLATY